jgi:hypothetical protein
MWHTPELAPLDTLVGVRGGSRDLESTTAVVGIFHLPVFFSQFFCRKTGCHSPTINHEKRVTVLKVEKTVEPKLLGESAEPPRYLWCKVLEEFFPRVK